MTIMVQVGPVHFLFESVCVFEYQHEVARQQDCCMARSCDICDIMIFLLE